MEIKPAKIFCVQGLCKLATNSNDSLSENLSGELNEIQEVCLINSDSQYSDLIFYLTHGYTPLALDLKKKRALRLKANKYQLVNSVLFKINYDSMLLRCLEKTKDDKFLQEMHDGPIEGHFGGDTTAHKILHVGYYWPSLFKYAHTYVRSRKTCQIASGRERKDALPLQPENIEQPFEKWGLDVIGEIDPHSFKKHKYILTVTDYFTKYAEAIPLKVVNSYTRMRVLIYAFKLMRHPRAEYKSPRLRQVVAMGSGLASAPREFTSLNGSSMQLISQGFDDSYLKMAHTFFILCLQFGSGIERLAVKVRVEEGGSEGSKPTLESIPCPILAVCPHSSKANLTLAVGLLGHRGNLSIGTLTGRRRHKAARLRPQRAAGYLGFIMAPRIGYLGPRRGRNSRQRGGTRGRDQSSPRRISPLAFASPPSCDSEHSDSDISNSVQTATLHYRRKRNKPVVKGMITIIFSEEDEEDGSWKAEMEEKTPPSSDNSTKLKDSADSSYNPELQSKIDEESTYGYSAEQAEALQEIGSLKGKEPMDTSEGPPEALMEVQISKPSSPQSKIKNEETKDSFDYALYLKLPPGIDCLEDLPDGMEVT